tara:strand:- start:356 stop:604 length:249 start_codon:yes stop_codon:yes gene_type:complete
MEYSKLSKLLKPNVEELYEIEDCEMFFEDNNLNINEYNKKWRFIIFSYTTDDFNSVINQLDSNNLDYTIETDYLNLFYILIK